MLLPPPLLVNEEVTILIVSMTLRNNGFRTGDSTVNFRSPSLVAGGLCLDFSFLHISAVCLVKSILGLHSNWICC